MLFIVFCLIFLFESGENNIDKIQAQVINSDIMPPGNITGITKVERNKINLWIKLGAFINN